MSELTILAEAAEVVGGDRNTDYGDIKESSLHRIAALWSAYLGIQIRPADVGHMMILLKVGRAGHAHKRDNYTDIAGYAHLTYETIEASTPPPLPPFTGLRLVS